MIPVPLNPNGAMIAPEKVYSETSYYDGQVPDGAVKWKAEWCVEKYDNTPSADVRAGIAVPSAVHHVKGNILTYGGGDVMWLGLKGGLTGTTGAKNTYFDNTNAAVIVGSSGAAEAIGDTDLSSSTDANRAASGMEATYPLHTTGDASTANMDLTFRSVFSTAQANFAWEEWGVTNTTKSTAPLAGRLLNRKAEALGTKTAAATWTFTVSLTLS